MDGADSSTSDTKRTALPTIDPCAYSARYVPTIRPIGVPIAAPSNVWIRLPMIAFSNPPCEPGGRVDVVKTDSARPPIPRYSRVNRMDASNTRPNTVAATQRPFTIRLAA